MATHSNILAWRMPKDRGGWCATVHGVAKSRTRLSDITSLYFNEDNGDLLQKVPCMHCYTQCPQSCSRPPLTHASTRYSWTLTGKSGSVSCGVTSPLSWVLVHTRFCLCPSRVYFWQSVSSGSSMVGLMVTSSKRAYAILKSAVPRAPASEAGHC